MISIIDYGMGNLRSVSKALEHLGAKVKLCPEGKSLKNAKKIILPGVGAFGDAMKELSRRGFPDIIKDHVKKGTKILGVCIGLQLFFESSEEALRVNGLSLFPGKVSRFRSKKVKIPHMGWNDLKIEKKHPLLKGIQTGDYFYFVHSYYGIPKIKSLTIASTTYGKESFAAVVGNDQVAATQFHPEKSQDAGLRILKNFINW